MAENEVKLPTEPMTGELLPCPFCGKANQDRWPCEWLDGSGANVVRCAWCHGAAPMDVWNRRATNPAADALGAVQALIADYKSCDPQANITYGGVVLALESAIAQAPAVRVTDEMVEKAARAIWERDRGNWFGGSSEYDDLHPDDQARLIGIAEAALGQGKAS